VRVVPTQLTPFRVDVRTHSGMTGLMLRPRVEDGAYRIEKISKACGLLFRQRTDVRAGRATITSLRGDLSDLREGQAETARTDHEA